MAGEAREGKAQMTEAEQKRINAEVRAHEAWRWLETIRRDREHIRALLANHDHTKGDNATRRDCERFKERLTELGLWDAINKEAGK